LSSSHLLHFYITVIRMVLEYCAPMWHYVLTKAQSESLHVEAVQKRTIHIVHNLTRGMSYSSILTVLFKSQFSGFSYRRSFSCFFSKCFEYRFLFSWSSSSTYTTGCHLKVRIFPNLSQSSYSHTPLLFFHTIWP